MDAEANGHVAGRGVMGGGDAGDRAGAYDVA